MKKPNLIIYPNDILRHKATKVVTFDDELKKQIKEMTLALREEPGVGLAANQIGYSNQVVVAEFIDENEKKENFPLSIFINPEIIEISEETELIEEGCLSLPKITLDVERAKSLKVKYQNENGQTIKFAPKGFLARILQHEIDHLNGIVFTDRVKEQFFVKNPELKDLKVLFCGTGEFASLVLEALYLIGFKLEIITEVAKPSGRHKEILPTPVIRTAKRYGLEYHETDRIVDLKSLAEKHKLLVCADFGQKIPAEIIDLPNLRSVNIHPSILPKYQGPTPIQTAILNDEKETGVTIIKMSNEIDRGPILIQASTEIFEEEDAVGLRDRLAMIGAKLLLKILPRLIDNTLEPQAQNQFFASFTKKFKKEDGEINWQKSPKEIDQQIRAFYPWPGSFTYINNKRLMILVAHIENDLLVPEIVQLEGKNPVYWTDFLRGYRDTKPGWFSKIKFNNN